MQDRSYLTTDGKQIGYITLLLQRLFLLSFMDRQPINQILAKYRSRIYEGMSFNFDDFSDGVQESNELQHAENLKNCLKEMVKMMGGDV